MTRTRVSLVALLWHAAAAALPRSAQIDAEVRRAMAAQGVLGLAVAVVDNGRATHAQAYGQRNARGEPLLPDTILCGASLTKAVFAYTVLQLADEGRIDLDTRTDQLLPLPLTSCPDDRR